MRLLLTVYHLLAWHGSFVLFGFFGLLLNLGSLLAGALPASTATERFFQRVIRRHFAAWLWWLRTTRLVLVSYTGALSDSARRGSIVVANHPGLLDATFLLAKLPPGFCVFKPSIRRNPVLGAAARRAGYVASDGGHEALRTAARKVAAGQTLIMFPEGTRSPAAVPLPFKPGFALIARIAQAPVQLVRISSNVPLLNKHAAWWRIPPLPVRVTVTFGPCLAPPEPTRKTADYIAEAERWYRDPTAIRSGASTPVATAAPVAAQERWQTVS